MVSQHQKPNIVWVMADDLSWGDLGCFGQERIMTPNIDRVREDGMRLTGCHSGSPVCAPSRSSLMQGLNQGHATVRGNMVWYPGGTYRHSLQPDDVTVAELLKESGYATGLFGKWGLAVYDQPGIPNNKGFDEFSGYLNQRKAHNYYPPYLWRNRRKVELPGNIGHDHTQPNQYDGEGRIIPNGVQDPTEACYSFDHYAEKSEEFIRGHADEPFFLYLAYTIPHAAFEVPELGEYESKDWPLPHKVYAAMVSRMDSAVGRMLDLLEELALADNTLIFFVSDNGYSFDNAVDDPSLDDVFDHRGPWKGAKGNLHQGGVRVPALARWPGRIEPGSSCDMPWTFWDFLPTAVEAAGGKVPDKTDGVSILSALLGEPDAVELPDYRYWEFHDEQAARIGDYWAYRSHPDEAIQIYDADNDPRQTTNLAEEEPELGDRADRIFSSERIPTPYFPSPGETPEDWTARRRQAGVKLCDNVNA
ncbi:MAG: arylsulfatase [Candidatus Brocadiia bacterium]